MRILKFSILLAALVGAMVPPPASAQFMTLGCAGGPCGSGAAGCSQATTFLARLSNLICNGLVPHGFWTGGAKACDVLHVLAANNSTDALLNLPSSITTVVSNAPTFTANKGYAGNGTSATVQVAGYNFASGTAYTQNSATIFTFNIQTAVDNGYTLGNSSPFNVNDNIQPYNFGQVFSGGINSATQLGSATLANGSDLFVVTRTSSTQTDAYQNTTNIAANAANTSSAIVSANPWYLGLASVSFAATTTTVAAAGVCAGWASTDVSNFRADLYNRYLHVVNPTQFP